MARRELVRMEEVAALENLATAFWRAAQGKRGRRDVRAFEERLEYELETLRHGILSGSVAVGRLRSFRIYDPKQRTIHAPCFPERVLHHALMAFVGPILERSLVADTFACRTGKGSLAAVRRVQHQSRRYSYFAKLDARSYFESIDHAVLMNLLRRRVKGGEALALLSRIVDSHACRPGKGLPIGALTSQHFANLYLGEVDRLLLEGYGLGLVRYMDDVVLWGNDKAEVRAGAEAAQAFARDRLALVLATKVPVTACERGVPFCGFRVFPQRLLLSQRRKRRYRRARQRWESAHALGLIDARALQAGYASVAAITAHGDAAAWRRMDLQRRPAPDV